MRRKRGWYVGEKRSKIVRMGGGRLCGGEKKQDSKKGRWKATWVKKGAGYAEKEGRK